MLPEVFTPELLNQIELLRLRSRKAFLGSRQGGHISLKKGHGIEFSDYRKYELGDNPRDIDWGVYARSDRLYVKRFQEEEDLAIHFILDASSSMFTPTNDDKWSMTKNLCLALSYSAFMAQDQVSLAVLGGAFYDGLSGAKAIHHLANLLEQVSNVGNLDLEANIQKVAARMKFPGKAFLISDFLYPISSIQRALDIFLSKNLDLCFIQVLGPNDIHPFPELSAARIEDSETGEMVDISLQEEDRERYRQALLSHMELLRELCASKQVSLAVVESKEDLLSFLVENISTLGLSR